MKHSRLLLEAPDGARGAATLPRAAQMLRLGALSLAAVLSLIALVPRPSAAAFASQQNAAMGGGSALPFACPGDCNSNREVTINELVAGVNLALGIGSSQTCPAMDWGGDGLVDVSELLRAVNASLIGCASAAARILRNEGNTDVQTAAILKDAGYSCPDCGLALKVEFDADAWTVGVDLKAAGCHCNQIGDALTTLFPSEVSQVLIDIDCGSGQYVDPAVPGYETLGKGYDVFTAWADSEFVKRNQILDVDLLNDDGKLYQDAIRKLDARTLSGSTISDYVKGLSTSLQLEGSYSFFSGSINAKYESNAAVTTEWSFATVQVRQKDSGLGVLPMAPAALQRYLSGPFASDINNQNSPPSMLFSQYGTHAIGLAVVGGRIDYDLTASISDESQKQNIGVYAKAKIGTAVDSLAVEGGADIVNNYKKYVKNQEETFSSVGGGATASNVWQLHDAASYSAWQTEVTAHPVFCDFGEDPWLIPIWELAPGVLADGTCQPSSRCEEIRQAYDAYAQSKPIRLRGPSRNVLVDVAVTQDTPSTQTGFKPLMDSNGSSALAYVNKGVSSKRTPAEQSDGIYPATPLWIAYKVTDQGTTETPINGIHLFTGSSDDLESELGYGQHTFLKFQGTAEKADLSYDTCQQATYWETTPCPTRLCAYDCDHVACTTANMNKRELHYTTKSTLLPDSPVQALVLADPAALNTAQAFEARKRSIWWGPQDLNNDGRVNDEDVQLVFEHVVWVSDSHGAPINVNAGAKNYYTYDYECPWGCCHISESITDAPAQYLGYVPYAGN